MSPIPTQSINFENNRAATAVFPPANAKAEEIIAALGLADYKAVLLVIGGADSIDDKLKPRLTQLFGRGIARAAANIGAAIIDGGTKAGVMEMIGQGVADRGFNSSLIGVAPRTLVAYPGSTSTGDVALDSNHSHFVLVDGDAWGSETSTIFQLVGQLRKKVPGVALLAGGGDTTRNEVLQAVRQSLPLIVVEGSGGLADELAAAWKARPDLPDDPLMAEVIADGRLEFHVLGSTVKGAERLIVRELGGDNVLMQAWDRFAVYDLNAILQKQRFDRLQMAILGIGLLATALAITKQVFEDKTPGWDLWWYLRYLLIVIPIFITILITVANKFKQGNKWLLLRSGAESIKREIYRYRARAGDYKGISPRATPAADGTPQPPPPTPEQVLAQRLQDITQQAMRTEVNSSSLIPYPKDKDFPPYVKYSGDDGFSVLTPDRYIEVRLADQLSYYKGSAVKHERKLKLIQWSIYIIGGLGTLLAALNQQVWIAVTTALATALATYLSYQQTETTVTKYNQAATDLDNVKSWWTALPADQQAKQDNVDTLVKHTEDVLQSELDGWVQQMQNALAELRKDQVKAPEKNDMTTPAPEIVAADNVGATTATGTIAPTNTDTPSENAEGAEATVDSAGDGEENAGSGTAEVGDDTTDVANDSGASDSAADEGSSEGSGENSGATENTGDNAGTTAAPVDESEGLGEQK
jgi:hypothetical protein